MGVHPATGCSAVLLLWKLLAPLKQSDLSVEATQATLAAYAGNATLYLLWRGGVVNPGAYSPVHLMHPRWTGRGAQRFAFPLVPPLYFTEKKQKHTGTTGV